MRPSRLFLAAGTALFLGIPLVPLEAQAVTLWNWAITGSDGTGSGTFETADVVPSPLTSYQIIGMTGSVTRQGVVTPVAALNSNFASFFQWNGGSQSPILVGPSGSGIFWFSSAPEESYFELYSSGPGAFAAADSLFFTSGSTGDLIYSISQSTLSPQQDPVGTPAPLPLAGAAVAYRLSRRVRKRLRKIRF